MKYPVLLLCIFTLVFNNASFSQEKKNKPHPKYGIKGGYNIAKMYGSSPTFKPDAKNGFMVAGYYSAGGGSGMGYRTELVFSRQGFSYDSAGNKMNVKQDYVYLPQFTTFTIGKFFQIQAGAQLGLLVNAIKRQDSSGARQVDVMDAYNKIDYGLAAGVEIYPARNLVLGGRYNISLGNMHKRQEEATRGGTPYPLPFNPDEVKGKNAVINFYAGFRF